MRANIFYIVLLCVFLIVGKQQLFAQKKEPKIANNGVKTIDLNTLKKDDSTKTKKPYLEDIVKYKAKEYAEFDNIKKLITLYDQAELFYQDYELKSGIIIFDYKKNEVYAGRLKDSVGNYIQYPVFKQGANLVEPDSIRFNFKTKKAKVWNSRTQQGEMNIKADISKKENDSVYYMKGVRITTAKDVDDPEYYFLAQKAKLVPGKKVVVGFTNMFIANVPTPIALPFAFFPMTTKQRSGVILPSYGQNNTRGYALQNGGYYFALSDNYDLAVTGDYYTNGSYSLRGETAYSKRYKYSGSVQVRYENQINSERGFPDYSKSKIFNIQWSHTKDSKSNPNSRFSASVNAGSSKYFSQSINQSNIGSSLNNTLSSSISYQTTLKTVPAVSLSVAATQSQNTKTNSIDLSLPTLQASVDRVFPFAPKNGIKKGFIKNINLNYNLNAKNTINTIDSLLFKSKFMDIAKIGFQHSIPISTNFKILKNFSATTSANYNEVWTLKTTEKYFDAQTQKVIDKNINGFDAFRTYSFSNQLGTTLYGTYDFKGKGRIKTIRHTMRPSISHTYAPSFDRYYNREYVSGIDGTKVKYTRFEGGLYGAPSQTYANTLGFSLGNLLEAKVVDKDSTKTELKKISLLSNLTMGTSYDLRTAQWSMISINGGTVLFKQKMNVNFGASIDPYKYEQKGYVRDAFAVDNANLTLNYSIKSASKTKEKNVQGEKNGGRSDDLFGTNTDLNKDSIDVDKKKEDTEKEFTGFYNTNIPWDMNLAYSMGYNNTTFGRKISYSSLMVSANTDLTPKWKIGISTSYDFVNKGIGMTSLRLNRDLMSWYMNVNWVPFGSYAQWGFFIGIKAGVFSDIKWDKRAQADRTLK